MSSPFTVTIDWLAFTLPVATASETMRALRGDWTKGERGFRGYPVSWMIAGGGRGIGMLGTGALRAPGEVHVDLSAGIVASWPQEKMRSVLQWIFSKGGHLTRIDCALDDRTSSVPLSTIRDAITAGQCVTRADHLQCISSGSIHKGTASGETITIGSRTSQTFLRIYDKRLALQGRKQEDWEQYGIRWELELKKDRAQLCGKILSHFQEHEWLEILISSFLRPYVEFKDTDREAKDENRCRAPLLDWWERLTDGLRKAPLVVEKEAQTLESVKRWVSKSLAPMLAVVCVAEPEGQAWLNQQLDAGVNRWKDRHRRLLQQRPRNKRRAQEAQPTPSGVKEN